MRIKLAVYSHAHIKITIIRAEGAEWAERIS